MGRWAIKNPGVNWNTTRNGKNTHGCGTIEEKAYILLGDWSRIIDLYLWSATIGCISLQGAIQGCRKKIYQREQLETLILEDMNHLSSEDAGERELLHIWGTEGGNPAL